MKNDVIKRRLARGAATTVAATAFVLPHDHAFDLPCPRHGEDLAHHNFTKLGRNETNGSLVHTEMRLQAPSPSEWDKHLEKEFRQLALLEAKGTLSDEDAERLERLNGWRDDLLCPQTAEAVLVQLKRDRILSKMEELLREYVEFQESTSKKRLAS